jgi:hypothetical protein
LITGEIISGLRAVNISSSGFLRIAMCGPASSGRLPAVGIALDNALSGQLLTYYMVGKFQAASGMVDYSGNIGRSLWVGTSGHIVTASGSWNSGGLASGGFAQRMGVAANSGGGVFVTRFLVTSGVIKAVGPFETSLF